MANIVPAVMNQLVGGVEDMLRQAAAVGTGNQANYIKDGEPESIYGKMQQATARQACRRIADDPSLTAGPFGVQMENACRPYLESIGYGQSPSIGKPFSGGQCPVGYLARYETRNRISTQFNCGTWSDWTEQTGVLPASTLPQGPITGIQTIRDFGSFPGNTNASVTYQVTAANGTYALNLGGTSGRLYYTDCGESWEYRNLRWEPVTAIDGECAPVPPTITIPPPPIGAPGPRIEPYNPGPGVDIDIAVEVNIDGTIDIDFGVGPVTIDPFGDEPTGEPGGGGPAPGDDGEPGDGETAGPAGDAEGEAPPGSVLVGLQMNMTFIPTEARTYSEGVYRGAAYIYMGGEAGLDQDFAGSLLRDGQFVYAEKDNLTRWRVRANNEFVFNVVPYYRSVE